MLISRVTIDLLRVPVPLPRTLPRAEDSGSLPPDAISVLLARLDTDDGPEGLGFAYDLTTSGRKSRLDRATIEDVIAPRLIGADPRLHRRLNAELRHDLPAAMHTVAAAVDIAVWDLAAKAAGLPLWQ